MRRAGFIVVFLALVMGCSRMQRARRELGSTDPVRRAAAAESLGVWGAKEMVSALADALGDTVPGVRERIVEAIGRLGDVHASPMLLSVLLHDDDAGVRRAAARALAELAPDDAALELLPSLEGPTATARLRAVNGLIEIIRARGDSLAPVTRARLGDGLGDVVRSMQARRSELPGNWRAWEQYLRGTIAPEDTLEVVADQAAVALAWLGGVPSGAGLLSALRGTISPVLRDSLLMVFAVRRDTVLIGRLVKEARVRMLSARRRAVALLGGLPDVLAEEALVQAAGDLMPEVRREAWRALLRVHGVRLSSDDEPPPRRFLRAWSPSAVTTARRAEDDVDSDVRLYAAVALAHAGDPAGVRRIVRIGTNAQGHRLELVCHALAGLPAQEEMLPMVTPVILRALRAREGSVRAAAYAALGTWKLPGAVVYLRSGLADEDTAVVHATLRAIARMGEMSLMAEMFPLLDADSLTRREAAHAFAAVADPQSVNYLILSLTSDKVARRRGAVEAVGLIAKRVWGTPDEAAYRTILSRAAPWLARIAAEEQTPADRARALWAIGYIRAYETYNALGLGLADDVETVRITAAVGLARQRPALSVKPLAHLARTGSLPVRLKAVELLGTLNSEDAREVLREISVVDRSPEVRLRARRSVRRVRATV